MFVYLLSTNFEANAKSDLNAGLPAETLLMLGLRC
ncbi:hypothetical protein Pan241w_19520 [Gimesia alba]|uniref:Uncharacterized protein n=1 Tax=Gimesia alba TaxID=2527973 RepID=A0A517RDF8_9PLAN|nr:hypothetical protein Pan241w_19520 [Gimesia alba]